MYMGDGAVEAKVIGYDRARDVVLLTHAPRLGIRCHLGWRWRSARRLSGVVPRGLYSVGSCAHGLITWLTDGALANEG